MRLSAQLSPRPSRLQGGPARPPPSSATVDLLPTEEGPLDTESLSSVSSLLPRVQAGDEGEGGVGSAALALPLGQHLPRQRQVAEGDEGCSLYLHDLGMSVLLLCDSHL
jgi:hypothetical protein